MGFENRRTPGGNSGVPLCCLSSLTSSSVLVTSHTTVSLDVLPNGNDSHPTGEGVQALRAAPGAQKAGKVAARCCPRMFL